MGGKSSKQSGTQTEVDIILGREVSQAGAALRGTVKIKIGSAQVKLLEGFESGALIKVNLSGFQRIFWAQGH